MAETLAKRERCSVWEGMLPHEILHLTLQLHALCQVPSVRDWNLSCACGRVQGRPVPSAGSVGQSEHYLTTSSMRRVLSECVDHRSSASTEPTVLIDCLLSWAWIMLPLCITTCIACLENLRVVQAHTCFNQPGAWTSLTASCS